MPWTGSTENQGRKLTVPHHTGGLDLHAFPSNRARLLPTIKGQEGRTMGNEWVRKGGTHSTGTAGQQSEQTAAAQGPGLPGRANKPGRAGTGKTQQ